jgi:outer membrane protein OmpA-like peptidoglycan-associated protein
LLAAVASTLLTGCLATQSQLKHSSDQQAMVLSQAQQAQTEVNGQLTTQLAAEKAQRTASDSALAQQLGMVTGDVQALRTELQTMRTDLGAKITAMEDGLHFMMPVNFAFDDATVRTDDAPVLGRFASVVQKYYPGSKITIEGFADPAGGERYNLALSQRRAVAVREYLVSQGLTTNELQVVGYGKSRLVVPKAKRDDPGAELNRRVTFVIESKPQRSVAIAPETPTP